MIYFIEEFTDEEKDILKRYFTNIDGPVFGLVNLPEVVKGALFARYSRTSKSLRRLFLDEFVGDLDVIEDDFTDANVGQKRAEELYNRIFFAYGDDSVAQLGGVHLACESASMYLTKVLEWGRLMGYLEQSTRYIPYSDKQDGRFRYYRSKKILKSKIGPEYINSMDSIFEIYSSLIPEMVQWATKRYPKQEQDSDFVYKQTINAKALDSIRGLLPLSTVSNLGIYANGQAFEQLLLRMNSSPVEEVKEYSKMMLKELRKMIPSFLTRVDKEDRGVEWSKYFAENRNQTKSAVEQILPDLFKNNSASNEVKLVEYDKDGEDKILAAIIFSNVTSNHETIKDRVEALSSSEKKQIIDAYVGERKNRRHKPGRAFEATSYRFDVVSDFGTFKDLQRHRMMTIEWQNFTVDNGYNIPEAVTEAGCEEKYKEAMQISADIYEKVKSVDELEAQYCVTHAHKVRYSITANARALTHMLELRTTPQGHPLYREVCQKMHTLIEKEANHKIIADSMKYVDHTTYELERLEAERAAEKRLKK